MHKFFIFRLFNGIGGDTPTNTLVILERFQITSIVGSEVCIGRGTALIGIHTSTDTVNCFFSAFFRSIRSIYPCTVIRPFDLLAVNCSGFCFATSRNLVHLLFAELV